VGGRKNVYCRVGGESNPDRASDRFLPGHFASNRQRDTPSRFRRQVPVSLHSASHRCCHVLFHCHPARILRILPETKTSPVDDIAAGFWLFQTLKPATDIYIAGTCTGEYMSPENGELYIMRDDDAEEWVSPTPVSTAIVDAVTAQTDLNAADIDDIEAYVDLADLHTLLSGDQEGPVSFEVENHGVMVDADGDISVID